MRCSALVRGRVLPFLLFVCSLLACGGDRSGQHDGDDQPGPNERAGNGGKNNDAGDNEFSSPTMPVPSVDAGTKTPSGPLELFPKNPVLVVTAADPSPSVTFELRRGGQRVIASSFMLLDADLGSIDADGTFTASGSLAGRVTVEASFTDSLAQTEITVQIEAEQNGETDDGSGVGSGGYGGVGGEGPGGPVDDATKAVLDGQPEADDSLTFLYPYDETVFPLGLLAPLLQWSESTHGTVDAIAVHMSGIDYDYRGYFGRPPALDAAAPFVRHPIPQAAWDSATRSVRGAVLELDLTVAIGGKAYGPIKRSFRIANGELKGTVYYQSYGTSLVENAPDAVGGNGLFGGATLAIQPGERAPRLVAGTMGGDEGCRVCHSVASKGARMLVQHGDVYSATSSYDLLNGDAESAYDGATNGLLGWIGMTPDGELGLGNARPLGYGAAGPTQLYDLGSGMVVPSTGLVELVTEAGFPSFSHDGTRVAFNFAAGPGDATIGGGDPKKLVMMDFDRDTTTFSNPQLLFQGDRDPGWPSFTPDGNSVVFEQLIASGDSYFYTRNGGKGELWWVDLVDGSTHALNKLNGDGYLPTNENGHDQDQQLNYEPTVAPIASGGYAWIVFMSRRLYGNVATIDPWRSDPREYDHNLEITTKKLWVAAIDLNVISELDGTMMMSQLPDDPSHPAFYLPGQELHAGNTRGYWVVDPCRPDGESCESGIDCCSGRCQADPETGESTCGAKTDECAKEFDSCEKASDCCDAALACINQICSQVIPL